MDAMLIMKLLHILSGIWFISGMLGRQFAYTQAAQSEDVRTTHSLLGLSERFERLMVIPGANAVILTGIATAWLQGLPLLGTLQGAGPNWPFASLLLSLVQIPLVIVVLAPRRARRRHLAAEALAQGRITPELAAALADRAVPAGRAVELTVVLVIVVLMVMKPF